MKKITPKPMTVSEDVEITSNGQKILLERGDKIIIEALADYSDEELRQYFSAGLRRKQPKSPDKVIWVVFEHEGKIDSAWESEDQALNRQMQLGSGSIDYEQVPYYQQPQS